MHELAFTPLADAELARLEADPAMASTVERLWRALDSIANDPGAPAVNRRHYRLGPGDRLKRGATLPSHGQEWLILWEWGEQEIVIHYIGLDI
jgi:hypothetical protein